LCHFQNAASAREDPPDYIPLSPEPMVQDVEDVKAHYKLQDIHVHAMRQDDYARLTRLPRMSWVEGDLHQREKMLWAKLFLTPKSVNKWIQLTRLQKPIFQLAECGDPSIPTRDLRGLYLKKEAVLKGMEGE
jgi:hypothetical protein